ncbi:MAG: CbiX/SirB N-terminal domain-containing protein [Nannocystis sp.]|uniref:sirohydrochlorin chelatase n=1 Tax=Nannocystis sp. TaxID=1962667 RepID=UPI002420AAD4|nr:CbiX/SirB N-terminal domain-containing protein [Nannocystis sp.]MBK9754157.1 CbiX/SirB N-terminal domain-containing protein [Nannocystis sp.]
MIADAIVLLAHGSPDPDWLAPVELTAARLRLLSPDTPVHVATLEHGPTLAAAIARLATDHRTIAVVPLFLSPGGKHIKRDVPALIAAVQAAYPQLTLHLSPGAIGMDEPVLDALAAAALRRAQLP